METIVASACEWKGLPKNMNNPLHTICSYMAMFPPCVPNYFIKKYSKEGQVVLDPFSGRGTTVLEACLLNRTGIGNDKNPLAYLLTKAKASTPHRGRILGRIGTLEREFNPDLINIEDVDQNIRMIFSDQTLKQLLFLKNNLKWRTRSADAFIAAMILGVMHGSSEGYLSLSMPNTFSMAPNYVKNYIREHKLERPNRDVFYVLRNKLERCYQKPPLKGRALSQDARKMSKVMSNSIDLVVTSPPYTRVIRYGQFNWIRLWFLGKTGKDVDKKLFFSQSIPRYSEFMSGILREIKRVVKINGKIVLVIGDVKDREKDVVYNLAEIVWKNCAEPLGFKLVEPIQADVISDGSKVSRIWGETRGNATKVDRVLVLERPA